MSNIAVIGDLESTLFFKAIGFDVYNTTDPETARSTINKLAEENTIVIYLTEQLASQLEADIRKYQSQITPAIILIPGSGGSQGIGRKQIRTMVQKAVGMDILKESSEVNL